MSAGGRLRRPRMDQPAPGFPSDPRVVGARKGTLRDRIRSDRRLTASTKVVGITLLDYLNGKTGWAWPSIATLAADACCDERTVRRAIRKLAHLGYIIVVEGGGTRRGERDGRTNSYTIHWHEKSADTLTEMSGIPEGGPQGDRSAPVSAPATENYRAGMSEMPDICAPEYRAGMPGDSAHLKPLRDSAQHARAREADDDDGVVAAAARLDSLARERAEKEAVERQRIADAGEKLRGATERDAGRLRQAIDARGLSAADVAARARVGLASVTKLLAGDRIKVTDQWRIRALLNMLERDARQRAVS